LNRALGWEPDDPAFGGWGFSVDLPWKPGNGRPGGAFRESNLSATLFAIAALRTLGPVAIRDCANVNTSFPGFAALARSAGLAIDEHRL